MVWEDASPGDKILHGQWAAMTVAELGGVTQVIHPQGDGWVRSFDAKTGQKLWEFDTNPKDSVWPKTRNELIATPVVYEGLVYIGNGQDPEHGEGPGHFYAIDPTQARRHHRERARLALRQDPPHDLDRRDQGRHRLRRRLQRLPARARRQDRRRFWTHDMLAAVWASPMLVDGKVYLGDEDGDVVVLAHGKEKKLLAENTLGSSVYGSVVPANGALLLMNRNQLWSLAEGGAGPTGP